MFPAEIWTVICEYVATGALVDAVQSLTALACCCRLLRDVVSGLEEEVIWKAQMLLCLPTPESRGMGELRRQRCRLVKPVQARLPCHNVVTFSRKGGYVKKYSSVKLKKREALVLERDGDRVYQLNALPRRSEQQNVHYAIGHTRRLECPETARLHGQVFVRDGELLFATVGGVRVLRLTQAMLDDWPYALHRPFDRLDRQHGFPYLVIQVGTCFWSRNLTVIHVEQWGMIENAPAEKRKRIMEHRGRVVRQRLEAAATAAQNAYDRLSTQHVLRLDQLLCQIESLIKQ